MVGLGGYANIILIGSQLLANFSVIFGLTLAMIYYRKMQELPVNQRLEINKLFSNSMLAVALVAVAWIIMHIEPRYTNQF